MSPYSFGPRTSIIQNLQLLPIFVQACSRDIFHFFGKIICCQSLSFHSYQLWLCLLHCIQIFAEKYHCYFQSVVEIQAKMHCMLIHANGSERTFVYFLFLFCRLCRNRRRRRRQCENHFEWLLRNGSDEHNDLFQEERDRETSTKRMCKHSKPLAFHSLAIYVKIKALLRLRCSLPFTNPKKHFILLLTCG